MKLRTILLLFFLSPWLLSAALPAFGQQAPSKSEPDELSSSDGLPVTPEQKAKHRTARRAVFRVFAHHWLGVDEKNYITMVVRKNPDYNPKLLEETLRNAKESERLSAPEIRRIKSELSDAEAHYQRLKNNNSGVTGPLLKEVDRLKAELAEAEKENKAAKAKVVELQSMPKTITYFVQVRGLKYGALLSPVSEADQLNGITYQGRGHFGFRVYRFYDPAAGWSDWLDVAAVPVQLSPAFHSLFGSFTGGGMFPNLQFSFQERDGNWTVVTAGGESFVNGKRVTPLPATWEDTPATMCVLPDPSAVATFLKSGKNPRDAARAVGEWTRENPDALEAHIKKTIENLEKSQ